MILKSYWLVPVVVGVAGAPLFAACGGGGDAHISSSSSGDSSASTTSSGGGAGQGGSGQGGAAQGGAGQGGSGQGGGGDNSAAIKAACDDFAKTLCEKINACAPFGITVLYGDVAACEARLPLGCPNNFMAPGETATAAELEACSVALAGASCDDALGNNLPPACQLPPGLTQDGNPCGDDIQCESRYCKEAMNDHCGVCAQKSAAGGVCVENADCDTGLICSGDANGKACVTPGKMGDACDVKKGCLPTLACRKGTCQPPLQQGNSCDPNIQLTLPECDVAHGLYCDFLSQKCAPLKTAQAGQDCGVIGFGYVLCVSGSTCDAPAQGQGKCIAPTPDGGACDPAKPSCTSPAQCIGNVCAIEDPATCNK